MSAEFVICLERAHKPLTDLFVEEVRRHEIVKQPQIIDDPELAVEQVGFFTLGIVASFGYSSRLQNDRNTGLTLVGAGALLEIPRAILGTSAKPEFEPNTERDIFIPEPVQEETVIGLLRGWLEHLKQ